jgi:hypothetical protein
MFALAKLLMHEFNLSLDKAELLVTPLLLIPVLALLVLAALALQTALKISRLGCVECGSRQHYWTQKQDDLCDECRIHKHAVKG